MKRTLINLLKFAISLLVLGYLVSNLRARDPQTFERLGQQPLRWSQLIAGWTCFSGVALGTAIRWWLGLRAAGLRYRLRTVVEVGLVAYAVSFAAFGPVGSDVVKAFLITSRQPAQRARALATVMIDHVIGLQCMLLFVSVAAFCVGLEGLSPGLRPWFWTMAAAALAGLVLFPLALRTERVLSALAKLPLPRSIVRRLISSGKFLPLYRTRWPLLALAGVASVLSMGFDVTGFYFVTRALPGAAPTLGEQTLIVPVAMLSGVVPLPANALGVLDTAVSFLYRSVTAGRVAGAQGLLATMLARLFGLGTAAIGLWLYLRRRPEMSGVVVNSD